MSVSRGEMGRTRRDRRTRAIGADGQYGTRGNPRTADHKARFAEMFPPYGQFRGCCRTPSRQPGKTSSLTCSLNRHSIERVSAWQGVRVADRVAGFVAVRLAEKTA